MVLLDLYILLSMFSMDPSLFSEVLSNQPFGYVVITVAENSGKYKFILL